MIIFGVSTKIMLVNGSNTTTFQEDEKVDVQQIFQTNAVNGPQRLPAQCFKTLGLMLSSPTDLAGSRFVRTERTLDFLTRNWHNNALEGWSR